VHATTGVNGDLSLLRLANLSFSMTAHSDLSEFVSCQTPIFFEIEIRKKEFNFTQRGRLVAKTIRVGGVDR